jgi:hypothetical protein
MYKELLQSTPLTFLPVIALVIFLSVWLVMFFRTVTRPRQEIDEAARLPLAHEETRHE